MRVIQVSVSRRRWPDIHRKGKENSLKTTNQFSISGAFNLSCQKTMMRRKRGRRNMEKKRNEYLMREKKFCVVNINFGLNENNNLFFFFSTSSFWPLANLPIIFIIFRPHHHRVLYICPLVIFFFSLLIKSMRHQVFFSLKKLL